MQYRHFGKTGKQVSVIGFGGNRFDVVNNSFDENVQLVVRAVTEGINYFDTAHLYSAGQSERIIGEGIKIVKSYSEKEIYVSTKSQLNVDPNAGSVLRRVENSLGVMGLERIAFFHIWGILDLEQFSKVMKPEGPIYGAIRAKEQKLIEHICVSVHLNADEINEVLKEGIFDGITIGFNALNWRYRIEGLRQAAEKGLGVAVMNPLGGGVIPRNEKFFSYLDTGAGVSSGALRFISAHKEVSTILCGVENIRDIDQSCNIAEKENTIVYGKTDLRKIYDFSSMGDNEICTGCLYCSKCPKGIEPYKLMSAYNDFIFNNNKNRFFFDRIKEWYGFTAYREYDCIGCGECENHCTQHLPIISRIHEINSWVRKNNLEILKICESVFPDDKSLSVAIYAASVIAAQIIECYKTIHGSIDFPLYVIDSNPERHGKLFGETGLIIHPPKEIIKLGIAYIVVANREYFGEIKSFLNTFVSETTEIVSI